MINSVVYREQELQYRLSDDAIQLHLFDGDKCRIAWTVSLSEFKESPEKLHKLLYSYGASILCGMLYQKLFGKNQNNKLNKKLGEPKKIPFNEFCQVFKGLDCAFVDGEKRLVWLSMTDGKSVVCFDYYGDMDHRLAFDFSQLKETNIKINQDVVHTGILPKYEWLEIELHLFRENEILERYLLSKEVTQYRIKGIKEGWEL